MECITLSTIPAHRWAITRTLPIPLAVLAAFAGLCAAGVLSISHLLDIPVPCGGSQGCATVAAHPSSKLFGIPIAYFGVAAYLTLLFLLTRAHRDNRARILFVTMAGLGTAISIFLLIYAHTVIGAPCVWCVVSGASMLLSFLFGIGLLKSAEAVRGAHPGLVWSAAILLAAVLGVQGHWMHRASLIPPVAEETLDALPEHELVEGAHALGSAGAPVTIVVFTDLWCSACRAIHTTLSDYQKTNPTGVRLVYRHLPLWNIRGHESSGIAAGMAEMAGEEGKFWEFVHEIYSRTQQLNKEGYLSLMESLGFDPAAVEERFEDPDDPAIARVQRDMALAERLSVTATPTFLVLINDNPPVSANQRTLPEILNAPEVLALLRNAAEAFKKALGSSLNIQQSD
jgi:protein-disulfide isomerase/uncharacterized membrane protein